MDFKIKEKLNVNSFTFKKKVMTEVEEIKGDKKNYTINDIRFFTMISFLNNLSEENNVLPELAKHQDLIPFMEEEIEPLYEEYILKDEIHFQVFCEIVEDLVNYYEREYQNSHYFTNMFYNVLDEIGDINQEDIISIVQEVANNVMKLMKNGALDKKPLNSSKPVLTVDKVQSDLENSKIQELINKYKKTEKNEDTTE